MMTRRGLPVRRLLPGLAVLAVVLAAAFALAPATVTRPWNPFAALAVADPETPVTRFKLARAGRDPAYWRAALDGAGLRIAALPASDIAAACPLPDAVRVVAGTVPLNSSFPASCPLALSYAMFETHALLPLARTRFGEDIAQVAHLGSYACTPGSHDAAAADYAKAAALDIAGVILADGRRIAVKRDWQGTDAPAKAFLHDLRDAACRSFGTVESPDAGNGRGGYLHMAMRPGGGCR